MTKVLNKKQQEQVKELAAPLFVGVEKLMRVFKENGDKTVYANVHKAVIELNKAMFVYRDNVPSWKLDDIRQALHKLIHSMPRLYRADAKYKELYDYLELLDQPIIKTGFIDKIKQAVANIRKNTR
jgi:hypothetical protein